MISNPINVHELPEDYCQISLGAWRFPLRFDVATIEVYSVESETIRLTSTVDETS